MNKILLFAAFMMLTIATYAQKASIKGNVVDSLTKEPLEYATVAILNSTDSSLISYTITQKAGLFKLSGIPVKGTRLIITFVGYNTFRKVLNLKPGVENDLGKISLNGKSLNEVKIVGERSPISIRKDTIEFNAEAFKTRPNAVVEDLLRLLPGVQVNYDGTITIQGKTVSKLKIDGKRFFGNDPKVASKNLDAGLIDKVQVYDDREDDPDHKLNDDEVGKIINLKMKKKIRKSTLGKVYAGVGSRDRYEVGGIISTFRDTLQVSLIGLMNNLSKTGFSSQDLYSMGGFDRGGGNPAWDGTFGRGWGGGIEKVASGGLNINNDYGEKLKMNLTYFYSNNDMVYNSKSFTEQTINDVKHIKDTILSSNGQNISSNNDQKHALTAYLQWKPDTLNELKYEPRFNITKGYNTSGGFGDSFNNIDGKLSESIYTGLENAKGVNFSHSFNYYHRFKRKGRSLTVNNSISLNETKNNEFNYNNIDSFTPKIKDELIDRYNYQPSVDNNVGISVNYFHQLIDKKLSTDIFFNTRYFNTAETNIFYDRDQSTLLYNRYLGDQSSDLKRTNFIQNFKPQITYQLKKMTFKFAVDMEHQDVNNMFNRDTVPDIKKNYLYFFPSFNFNGYGFSLSYSQYAELPRINQMQPVTRRYNQFYSSTGNPNLQPGRQNRVYISYYKYDHGKQLSSNFYGSLTWKDNSIISIQTRTGEGVTTSTYVNRAGTMSAYGGASLGKQFKKTKDWQVGVNANTNINYNRSAFFLNGKEGIQNNYYVTLSPTMSFNYKSLLSFNTKYQLNGNVTKYKDIDAKSINSLRHTVGSDISLRWPARMIFDINYNYNYNSQVAQGFPKSSNILNAAITVLMLKKDRGQLKLQAYDLLDQNISVGRYGYNNSVTTSEQQILKRYFMLTYQIKLNSFK